jgi:hypothetical protein
MSLIGTSPSRNDGIMSRQEFHGTRVLMVLHVFLKL